MINMHNLITKSSSNTYFMFLKSGEKYCDCYIYNKEVLDAELLENFLLKKAKCLNYDLSEEKLIEIMNCRTKIRTYCYECDKKDK